MNHIDLLPPWLALVIAVLVLLSALLVLIGTIGLLRLKGFYRRVHAPTLGTTMGTAAMLVAVVLFFSATQGRPVVHVLLVGVFLTMTTPITLMLLVRAALERDRREGKQEVARVRTDQRDRSRADD